VRIGLDAYHRWHGCDDVGFLSGNGGGAMNARAGGGLVASVQAVIAAGVPPVMANTSSAPALLHI
jgi:hypothetical protein